MRQSMSPIAVTVFFVVYIGLIAFVPGYAEPYTGPAFEQAKSGTYISEDQKNLEDTTVKLVNAVLKAFLVYSGDAEHTFFSTNGMIPGQKTFGDKFVDFLKRDHQSDFDSFNYQMGKASKDYYKNPMKYYQDIGRNFGRWLSSFGSSSGY